MSQPGSSLLNLLKFYTTNHEPDSDEEDEKEHERVLNQISPRKNSNLSDDPVQMILMQGAQAASKIKEKKKHKK